MKESVREVVWGCGLFLGSMISRAFARAHYGPGTLIASSATAIWFLGWLATDNLLFKKEIAAQKERLAERRAAVRAAKYVAARERARHEPRS